MINIAIMGANGRMGRMLIRSVLSCANAKLAYAFVRKSDLVGLDVGEFVGVGKAGVALSCLADYDGNTIDVLIDFSLPEAFDETIAFCDKHSIRLVMGVTGLDDDKLVRLQQFAKRHASVYAGNYSTGVNVLLDVLATTAKTLGADCDVEIIESHHKHKKDAPSGTALMMAKAISDARNQVLSDVLVYGRQGTSLRQAGEIGIHAVRGGEIVGEHSVRFISGGEMIEISHKAQSRQAFADGAVRAALWLANQPARLYDMQDVLGLS